MNYISFYKIFIRFYDILAMLIRTTFLNYANYATLNIYTLQYTYLLPLTALIQNCIIYAFDFLSNYHKNIHTL